MTRVDNWAPNPISSRWIKKRYRACKRFFLGFYLIKTNELSSLHQTNNNNTAISCGMNMNINHQPTISFTFILTLLLTLILAPTSFAADRLGEPIRFAIIGDRTGSHAPRVYQDIIKEIELLKPDFTIAVGDMIEGYTDDMDEIRQQWEEYVTLIEPLSAPIYHTPGNHDIWIDGTDASINLYKEFIGDLNYSFDHRGVHFVVMDNSRWGKIDELPQETIEWLTNDLQNNSEALYILVFYHIPYWFESLAQGLPDKLHDIFKEYGVDAVFTGHYHEFFADEYDGIIYTSIGSSGGIASPGITGLLYHFAWVTIDKDGIHIALIKNESVLPWDEVTAEEQVVVNKIKAEAVYSTTPVIVDAEMNITNATWEFTLKNPNTKIPLMTTMRWEIPEGWTVEPATLQINLNPGEKMPVKVILSCKGMLFPTPKFLLDIPYKEGATYEFSRQIMVKRQTICTYAKNQPKIDGIVNEGDIWKHADTQLFGPDGGKATTDDTAFYFAYDEKNLYIGTICQENKPDKIYASETVRDGAVYGEDCIGFFLVPPHGEGAFNNYQIYFNPNGTIFDQKITIEDENITAADLDWNVNCEVKTVKKYGLWTVEARIPLKELGVTKVKSGDQWQVNFRRKQKRLETSADWMIPVGYDPASYGIMVIE